MNKLGLLGSSALGSAIFATSFAVAAPAFAQAAPAPTAAPGAQPGTNCEAGPTKGATSPSCPETLRQNETELQSGQTASDGASSEQIVVTGTRINRPNLTSSVPITSLGVQELTSAGNVSLGDQLNQLPQLRATFTQANSTRFIGTAGINALDLRGLGSARTLVLVNGRRQITATPGIERVDVNTIPTDLVERVDIVTGGNSAVYGSDAVAGVVNFVLKRNFDGIRVRGQGGISSQHDRGSYFVSVTAGKNFAGGRGNIAVAAEYAKQETLYFTDRPEQTGAFAGRTQFQLVENTGPQLNPAIGPTRTGAEPATGNGIPDRQLLTNVKNNNISLGGLFTATCPVSAAAGESAAAFAARRAVACSGLPTPSSTNSLAQFGRTFVFLPGGDLVANPCVTDFRQFGSSNCVGGFGSTLRETGMLAPGLERKAINLLAHFDVSEAFQPFVEAKFVRIDANQEGQPTFFNNSFSIDNPFLTQQARAQLQQALAPGATTFVAQRFNVDFGGRGELHRRDTYTVVAGVGGTFNTDWKYEASINYGHLYTYYQTQGNLLRARYANSIDAVRNAQGQIVCRVNQVTVTDPACVPVNLFGNGQVSQAALNYFGYTSSRVQRANLYDAQAFVSGDLSQLFELPGGPIAFVLGGEIRKETAFAAYDPTTSSTACGASGCTFLNVIPNFQPPNLVVKDVFGELSIPLLKGLPFAHELSIDAAGRYSHYNIGKTGGVFAWNVNGTYAPVRDLRFRAGYARAIRAPTQSDLYAPQSQTFLNTFTDPCGQQNINSNPNRAKNCAAAGVPTTQTFAGTTEPFTNRVASGILGFNGSNPNLREEKSTSLTIGGVFQPRWIPGLSLTVDYYRIKLDQVIFSLGAQTIINACYDAPSGINNQYCSSIFRNPNGTFAGQSNVIQGGNTVSLTPTGASFISGPFNYAKQETSGIDFDMAYRTKITSDVRLNLRGILTHTFKKNNYTDINDPTFYDRQLSELGDPEWQAQLSANLEVGIVNFGYRVRWLGKQIVGPVDYETFFSVQGRPPLDPDAYPYAWYPNVFYHDFRIDLTPNNRFKFYMGVDNAFNRLPPRDLLGNEGGNPYTPVGRFFYAGAEVKF